MNNNLIAATTKLDLSNPIVCRALPKNPTDIQIAQLNDLLTSIKKRHGLQVEMMLMPMTKLFDKMTTEDASIGSWYQYGSCFITDLMAGLIKRAYVTDLASQSMQSSITGYTELGNMNMPNGIDMFFMQPKLAVDIRSYELNIKTIDTLKSIPTVLLATSRLIFKNGFNNIPEWSVDMWNLETQNPIYFDFGFKVSFPERNASNRLKLSSKSNRIFTAESTASKTKEVFWDTFGGYLFDDFKGEYVQGTYPLPLAPVDLTFDFGVGPTITVAAPDLVTLIANINAHPILSQIYVATDLGAGTFGIGSIDPDLQMVSSIWTSTTAGFLVSSYAAMIDLGSVLDRCHPYTQSMFIAGSSRNFYIEGADTFLRVVVTPVTDCTNSATSTILSISQ